MVATKAFDYNFVVHVFIRISFYLLTYVLYCTLHRPNDSVLEIFAQFEQE